MGTTAERLAGGRRSYSGQRSKIIKTLEAEAKSMFEKDVRDIIKNLEKLPKAIGVTPKGKVVTREKRTQAALRKSAKAFLPHLQKNTPRGSKMHARYPKNGDPIKYYPGNARRSMKVFKLAKANPLAIFAGPRKRTGPKEGDFDSTKHFDPYYVPFLESGTYFGNKRYDILDKSYKQGRDKARSVLKKQVENIFRYYARKKGLGKI
jgi:hypothetical protein